MEAIVNLILCSCAFLLSASALIFNVIFNRMERKRGIRQTLTVTLNDIAKINIEISKLKKEQGIDAEQLNQKRNYDAQRYILIIDADFLINENPALLTAIDCSLMAYSYNEIGDYEKAAYYFKEAISKADNINVRHINTRDYAYFLFYRNKINEGRIEFKKALQYKPDETDDTRIILIHTYLSWASCENAFDNRAEFTGLINTAFDICKKIQNHPERDIMKARVDSALKNANGKAA